MPKTRYARQPETSCFLLFELLPLDIEYSYFSEYILADFERHIVLFNLCSGFDSL